MEQTLQDAGESSCVARALLKVATPQNCMRTRCELCVGLERQWTSSFTGYILDDGAKDVNVMYKGSVWRATVDGTGTQSMALADSALDGLAKLHLTDTDHS